MYFYIFPVAFSIFLDFTHASPLFERNSVSCADIAPPSVYNATVVNIERKERHNYTVEGNPALFTSTVSNLDICEVRITLNHPGAGDNVLVQVWLPLKNWNKRFIAVGGSGWAAGLGEYTLAPAVAQGFAAVSTDAGLSGDPQSPGLWALKENGEVNLELLTNFASRSIHDMAVAGKAVTQSFYGTAADFSYWNGCSTGGRQGLVAAQKYPEDFDGILAGAPAIYWPEYVVAEQWPQVVMKEEGTFPSQCELNSITQSAIAACDSLDGVQDNVITDPTKCKFDPFTLVGSKIQCEGKEVTISRSTASVVRKIWDGPRIQSKRPLWYGLTIGAPLDYLANTTATTSGRVGNPFLINDAWIRYFLQANPKFNTSTIGSNELKKLFFESSRKYDDIIGSANPDLSRLQASGGKLLVWHGGFDQLIFPQGTIKYREHVERLMGKSSKVDEFFRLFIAPGVDHCGFGLTEGAIPSNPFGALAAWVENGTAPDTLDAETPPTAKQHNTRKICRYPYQSKYRGNGDPTSSESYDCVYNHRGW